jgi:hypothetical protein
LSLHFTIEIECTRVGLSNQSDESLAESIGETAVTPFHDGCVLPLPVHLDLFAIAVEHWF